MKKIIVTNTFRSWIEQWGYRDLLDRIRELEKTQEIVFLELSDEDYQRVSSYYGIRMITREE